MRFVYAVVVCTGLCWGAAFAQTPPMGDEDLNDLMALRAKVMIDAHQLQMEVRQALGNPAHTSPEIEALRKKIQDLQNAIIATQTEIKAKVEALPEIKAKIKKVEDANKIVEDLNKKIEAKTGTK